MFSKRSKYPKEPFPLEPPNEESKFLEMKSAMTVWANKINTSMADRAILDGGENNGN